MKLSYNHIVLTLLLFSFIPSQAQDYWVKKKENSITQTKRSTVKLPKKYEVFKLQMDAFKNLVTNSPMRGEGSANEGVEVFFPLANGELKAFKVLEAPVLDTKLSSRFPDIKSYAGQGIDDPTEIIRFSISQKGLSSMLFSSNNGYEFIEPYTKDFTHYIVYKRKDRHREQSDFECSVTASAKAKVKANGDTRNNADDGNLRTFRLAVSTNGEYTNYHGGTVADALAAINTTMTRVNGIFEVDFNVTMTLINNTTDVIYTNSGSDPYSTNSGQWNSQLQNTLTSEIGEANYDVGHLFAQGGNSGNAGCIGCVCVNNQKGSGWTSRAIPEGDPFDVDYVAHELGHQYGGNHTWTHGGNEGTNVQMEPGSGSTIMGYAGITGNTDVQSNSDPYFHAVSIEQITDYVKSTSCQTTTATGNSVPTADAGADYTIPRGTPFILTGSGSDNDGDALTYCWEQMDENNASTTFPSATATTGVAFRSINPSTTPDRTFPALATVLSGLTATTWEVVPNVGRTLNFRMTVRDNVAGGGTNESDNMVVTVNGTTGPFVVNTPNTNINWIEGSSQTVSWDVAGTNGAPVNASNVNILLSTDGGNTFSTTLASNTPNDGSHIITVPNNIGTTNRIKVEAANNIFFDISNTNFSITESVPCTATTPTGLSVSAVSSTTANLSWSAVAGAANYDVRYRVTGTTTWSNNLVAGVSTTLTGLNPLSSYEAQVRSNCPDGSNSAFSSSVTFTTTEVPLNYCASNGNNLSDEYIGNVTIAEINNTSGASAGGYADYTAQVASLVIGGSTSITITPVWTGTIYAEGYSVWIDYNVDGDFDDAGEQVYTQSATTTTPVTGSFTVPASASIGTTRMRVSMKYNDIPDPCESFTYGEVEDYTVDISDASCNVGESCDDSDACTTGDVYDADCNCAGTFADADGDGVCDADDICPGGDDNQDVDGDGIPDACDSCDGNLEGTSCDDGDTCTTGDVYDVDCNCAGTFADADGDGVCDADDICPEGDDNQDADGDGIPDACDTCDETLEGTSCDDGDACTTGDVYDADCNCAGTFADADGDGVCDADDQCPGEDDNQDADGDGIPDACDTCDGNLEGTSCDDGDACTTGDVYDADCNCAGTFADADGDGVCDADDICPGGDDNQDVDGDGIPDACDNCNGNLEGTFCDDGDACTTGDVYDANCNCAGTFADADGDGVCDADDICPGGDDGQDADGDGIPDACDNCDGNLEGTSCDDGDACTTGDVYDADCNCTGTIQDADGDGVCDADDQCPGSANGSSVDANGCVQGCTDVTAHNYDSNAQVDDNSCQTCTDGVQNGDETGIDCGGSCDDPCDISYCSSNGNNTSDEYIGNVTISNVNNTTGASSGGYGDYTSMVADLYQNQSTAISITPIWTGTIYNEAYSVWIDYNKDGDFTDPGEQVFTQSPTNATPINGSFTIPSSSIVGTTVMRVSMKYNALPTSCESFSWGEVEDYSVNISADGCPIGGACDDGDACTTGDIYDANCNCAGTYQDSDNDGVCDADDLCPGTPAGVSVDADGCEEGNCTFQTFNSNDFESGFGIWNDGGSDCRRSINDQTYANSGQYCVRLRDNTSTSTTTTDNLDLSSYSEAKIDFNFFPRSMDNSNEDLWLQISTNGGTSYTTIQEWDTNIDFVNGVREFEEVTIPGPFTSNTRFRFRLDASGNSDWVYLDDIVISICANSSSSRSENIVISGLETNEDNVISDLSLQPNPTRNNVDVIYTSTKNSTTQMYILDMAGKIMMTDIYKDESGKQIKNLDVSGINNGVYAITLVNGKQRLTKRLIIVK